MKRIFKHFFVWQPQLIIPTPSECSLSTNPFYMTCRKAIGSDGRWYEAAGGDDVETYDLSLK